MQFTRSVLLSATTIYCLGREPSLAVKAGTIDKTSNRSVMIMQHLDLEQLSDMVFHASSSLLCVREAWHGECTCQLPHGACVHKTFKQSSLAKAAMGAQFSQQIHLGILGCRSECTT